MRDADGMREALRYFRLAVQRDPKYAQAYVGLAKTYNLLGTYELLLPSESFSKVRHFAGKALQLDGTLSEAYTARAIAVSFWGFDWAGADRDFQHAIALNQNSAEAHHWYGEHLINLGLAERAVLELKPARALDPLSLAISSTLGRVYRDAHRYHEAVEQCQNTVHLAPKFSTGH